VAVSASRDLADAIADRTPFDEREAASLVATLDRLTWAVDPFDETANDHHLTASSFVVSSRGLILHRHKTLNIWVQPGGHVDVGEGPADAALRETREETGLDVIHLDAARPYHVDVHPGPRGHTHYDLRYLLRAPPQDPSPAPGESPDVYWFDFDAATTRAEPDLAAVLGRLAREVASGAWETGS
jgi:8-oxo-dGTP pyrophosphatase MutT (NUDIX family)